MMAYYGTCNQWPYTMTHVTNSSALCNAYVINNGTLRNAHVINGVTHMAHVINALARE